MKRFSSNRLYIPHLDMVLRNHVVEIDEVSGEVVAYYPFTEETSFTEWLGGLIIVSGVAPDISCDGEGSLLRVFVDEDRKLRSALSGGNIDNALLKAYHITDFNVSMMCFSEESRVVQLL